MDEETKKLLHKCGVALRHYELLLNKDGIAYPFGKDVEKEIVALVGKGWGREGDKSEILA